MPRACSRSSIGSKRPVRSISLRTPGRASPRLKLGLPGGEHEAKKTSIIITDVNELTIGTIVDDVEEVVGFDVEQVETDLDISSSVRRDYVLGVAKSSDAKLVLLLDIRKVLNAEELELMKRETSGAVN